MKEHLIEVPITMKPEVPDPLAFRMTEKIRAKGFEEAEVIQTGRYFQLTINASSRKEAVEIADEFLKKFNFGYESIRNVLSFCKIS